MTFPNGRELWRRGDSNANISILVRILSHHILYFTRTIFHFPDSPNLSNRFHIASTEFVSLTVCCHLHYFSDTIHSLSYSWASIFSLVRRCLYWVAINVYWYYVVLRPTGIVIAKTNVSSTFNVLSVIVVLRPIKIVIAKTKADSTLNL